MKALESYYAESNAIAQEQGDNEASCDLWIAVLRKTRTDFLVIHRYSSKITLTSSQTGRLRRIYEFPPQGFVLSTRFAEICKSLGLDPTRTRAWIQGGAR